MFKKHFTKLLLVLFATATFGANAAVYELTGSVTNSTGAFAALLPAGTGILGPLDITFTAGVAGPGDVNSANINVGGFCFSTDMPSMCPNGGADVPITSVDGAALTLAGTMVGGTLDITTFSPTFNIFIPISFDFDAGTFLAFNAAFGIVEGDVALGAAAVPVPAAVWFMGSALLGLIGMRRRG